MRIWSPPFRTLRSVRTEGKSASWAWALALAVALGWPGARASLLDEPPPEYRPLPSATEQTAPPQPPPKAPPPPPGGLRRDNVLLLGGEPTALFWADGLTSPEDLAQYAALGFNALRVPVTSSSAELLAQAQRLADQAAQAGLLVLVDLRPDPQVFQTDRGSAPQSPLSASYRLAARRFVRAVVPPLQSHKALAAWVVSGVDAENVHYSQSDFWAYLRQWQGGLGAINQAWGSRFPTLLQINDAAIRALDASRPGGVGVATLDLARYRQQAYADLLAVWAAEIHGLDRSHALLAGRVRAYRSAVSVPADKFEGIVCGFYPTVCEQDVLTHNAHGIDIARRANRLAALPLLTSELQVPPSRVGEWVAEAVVHGAAGVGFSSWQAIQSDAALQRAVGEALTVTRGLGLCPITPSARIAVLYQPFAAGALQAGLPLYGYARGVSDTEPGRLFSALRRGTRFGPVDYITHEELLHITPDRYRVVLAPLALYLPQGAQLVIERYVAAGGIFVADLGVGMYQSGGDMTALPPVLVRLFGLKRVCRVEKRGPVWHVLSTPKRLPSLRIGDSPSQNAWTTPFAGLTTFLTVDFDVVPLLSSYELAQQYGGYCGLLMRPVGQGHALYATSRLWEDWLPGNRLFDKLFSDLMGPDSDLAVAVPDSLASPCEVVPCADGRLLVHNTGDMAQVLLANPQCRVYHMPGGVQAIRPKQISSNSLLILPGGRLLAAQPLPLTLTPLELPAHVQVAAYDRERIDLVVHCGMSRVQPDAQGRLAIIPSGTVVVEVTVKDGVYPVAPRSSHQVIGKPLIKGKPWRKTYRADAAGVLSFRCASAGSLITIKPAPAQPSES